MSVVRIVSEEPQVRNPYHKKGNHLTNAAVTVAGTGATAVLLSKGIKQANCVLGDSIALSNGSKILKTSKGKVYKFFERAGEKLFGEKTKLGQMIKRYTTGELSSGGRMCKPDQILAHIKKYKTVGAMALAAGFAGLAFLANGIYKAGKINADK